MQAMNRAIEGASDFSEMMRKLQEPAVTLKQELTREVVPQKLPKQPGENREQYRARLRSMRVKA